MIGPIDKKAPKELNFWKNQYMILKSLMDTIEFHLVPSNSICLDTGSDIDWYKCVVDYITKNYKKANQI